MAERSPVDRMTQRRLEEELVPAEPEDGEPEADPVPVDHEPAALPDETPTPPTAKPPLHLEGASDVELRKRQDAWYAERSRHEAFRRARRAEEAASVGSQR
jgi:hypothetical protein